MTCTVIIPVRNGEATIGRCVRALVKSDVRPDEIIAVDDASTDGTAEIAGQAGARVITSPHPSGPAAARNLGAQTARGDVLVFVDADVVVEPDAVGRLVKHLEADDGLVAVFGSYDDAPDAPQFASQYRNLLHHYIHQTGRPDASTFWAGCGAVRRDAFDAVGGFDARTYTRPCIEDIELGIRLVAAGGRIRLDRMIRSRHLKRWTLWGLIKTDVLHRAVPWSRLVASGVPLPVDLNFRWPDRACGVLVSLGLLASVAGPVIQPGWGWLALLPIVTLGVVLLKLGLFRFFARSRSLGFALAAVPLQLIYYAGSSLVFGATLVAARLNRVFAPRPPNPSPSPTLRNSSRPSL